MQYIPGPPPMSDAANGVSGATMRVGEAGEPNHSRANEGTVPEWPQMTT